MADVTIHRRWMEVQGRRVFLLEAGDGAGGPPVVLLPSMIVMATTYRPTMRVLGRRGFRVVVPELPGCGRSSYLPRPWDFEAYGRFVGGPLLDALRAALGIDRPVLIGHSNSGAAALAAAAFYPDRVARLVLTDAVGADAVHSLPRVLAARSLDAVIEWRLTAAAWHHAAYNAASQANSCARQVWLAAKADLLYLAARVPVPTLLAWGARDHTMPLRCARAVRPAGGRAPVRLADGQPRLAGGPPGGVRGDVAPLRAGSRAPAAECRGDRAGGRGPGGVGGAGRRAARVSRGRPRARE